MDYEKDLKIDDSALDLECLDQADLMRIYTREQADLQREEELAKERLDFVQAELDKNIRSDPDRYGLDKITEGAIRNTIVLDEEYKVASKAFINAKYENNVCKGTVRALDHRRNMIENLVKLHGQSYFAGPKLPRDINLEAAKKREEEKMDTKIGSTLKRTRKS